jgi:hypothetical protein
VSLSRSMDDVRRSVERYAEVGVDYVIASWPEEGRARVEAFAEALMVA